MLNLRLQTKGAGFGGRMNFFKSLALAAVAVFAFSLSAKAQDAAELTGADYWRTGGCFDCHGNLANGDGDPVYPAGPNLRRTRLDREQLITAIACGRPFAQMPMNLAGAYLEVACYGMPIGEVPEGVLAGASFTAEEIESLVDFLMEHVVGQTTITRENCSLFFGGNLNAPLCFQF